MSDFDSAMGSARILRALPQILCGSSGRDAYEEIVAAPQNAEQSAQDVRATHE